MATKAEIRNRVANDLGILPLNQSLQNEHKVRIEAGYDEVYARLVKQGLAQWASTAAVPSEIVPYMVTLVADNCLKTYAVSVETYQRIKLDAGQNGETAIDNIRELIATDYALPDDNPTDF